MNCKSFSTWQEKQLIIDTFIKRIYLWEDKILIIYRLNPRDDTSTSDEDIAVDYITKALSENVSDNAMLGSSSWARTSDIMINSHALCQLSYRGICYFVLTFHDTPKITTFVVIFSTSFVPATFYFSRQSPAKYHRR